MLSISGFEKLHDGGSGVCWVASEEDEGRQGTGDYGEYMLIMVRDGAVQMKTDTELPTRA